MQQTHPVHAFRGFTARREPRWDIADHRPVPSPQRSQGYHERMADEMWNAPYVYPSSKETGPKTPGRSTVNAGSGSSVRSRSHSSASGSGTHSGSHSQSSVAQQSVYKDRREASIHRGSSVAHRTSGALNSRGSINSASNYKKPTRPDKRKGHIVSKSSKRSATF